MNTNVEEEHAMISSHLRSCKDLLDLFKDNSLVEIITVVSSPLSLKLGEI